MGRSGKGPGMAFCDVCRVECAPGSMSAHVSGQKHQAKLRGSSTSSGYGASTDPSSKPYFYFPQGRCFKGSACPYLHAPEGGRSIGTAPPSQPVGAVPPPIAALRPFLAGATVMESAFVLAKSAAAVVAAPALPAQYCGLLKRKQGVNLYVSGGRVVWQFAYNASVIGAIKAHIKGRQWEPSLGPKGCWTSPLETLPEAVALYEHMGRTPDPLLKARARQVVQACGGGSAADAITLTARPCSP